MGYPKSGKIGVVNGQSTIRNWSISRTSDTKKYAASNTQGGMGAVAGAMDWSGSFMGNGGQPAVMPGETFTFEGGTSEDNTGAKSYSGSAIVDQVAITWNFGAQEILSYTVNFSGNGELTENSTAFTDATTPVAPPASDTDIYLSATAPTVAAPDIATALPDVEQAVLTLTSANTAYVNSSTITAGVAHTKRRPGNIDWTLSITQQNLEGLGTLDLQKDLAAQLFTSVSGNTKWELLWGHMEEATGITVDSDSGDIIRRTLNLTMNAQKAGDVFGRIVLPDGTVWWGTAAV